MQLNDVIKMKRKELNKDDMDFEDYPNHVGSEKNGYNSALSDLKKWRFDKKALVKLLKTHSHNNCGRTVLQDLSDGLQPSLANKIMEQLADSILSHMDVILVKEGK